MISNFDHLAFLVRPADQGKMVEISYAWDANRERVVRRIYDPTDDTGSFAMAEDHREVFEPWNNQRFDHLDWVEVAVAGYPAPVEARSLAARLLDGDRDDEAGPTFTRLNNAGEGFDPDDDLGGWDLVYRAQNDTEVSVYADGDDAILVGDANGAWAVRVSA